ncbi:MAG: hypothetical protein GEV10_06400 [Streptosporangiales bacterium]|nr:hypothetical protein [Streptosporangiales bacterium]
MNRDDIGAADVVAARVRALARRLLASEYATASAKHRARIVLGLPAVDLEREVLDLLRSELGAEVAP